MRPGLALEMLAAERSAEFERLRSRLSTTEPGECWLWTGKPNAGGYGRVYSDGKMRYAHRVVYELLVKPIPPGKEIDHKCPNKSCANPGHLDLVKHAENQRRIVQRGRIASGPDHPQAVLTVDQVLAIDKALRRKVPEQDLAAQFSVTRSTIHAIRQGRTWRRVTHRRTVRQRRQPSLQQTREALELLLAGESGQQVARRLGLSPSTVSRIKNQRSNRAVRASLVFETR